MSKIKILILAILVVGISCDKNAGRFIPKIIHELYPYDAGILSDNSVLAMDYCDREPLSVPQEKIHLITTERGEAIGPGSLGQIVLQLLLRVIYPKKGKNSSFINLLT